MIRTRDTDEQVVDVLKLEDVLLRQLRIDGRLQNLSSLLAEALFKQYLDPQAWIVLNTFVDETMHEQLEPFQQYNG